MAKSGITLKLEGFEDLLKDIEASGRSMNSAVDSAMRQSAHIMQSELKNQMQKANVKSDLISRMPSPSIQWDGNECKAEVGYEKGSYNPKKPTDGYKVIFLNYGTPHRTKHGKVEARGFIGAAKKSAKPRIKRAQKEALEKILERLKKK